MAIVDLSRRRALLACSALAVVPLVAGCDLTPSQTTVIQADLQTAITVGETVDSLLSLLGVTVAECALAAAALTAAQAALTAWEKSPNDSLALTVLANVGTIYGYLPTADQTALAKIKAQVDVAETALTDPNVITLAVEVAAVLPEVQSQLKVAQAARATALKGIAQ